MLCPPESERAMFHIEHNPDHEGVVNDYYPLTVGEISDLLHAARSAHHHPDARTRLQNKASIQIRLCQGIAGTTCPSHDETADARSNALEGFYVRWAENIGKDEPISEWTVHQFDLLINGGECCETDAPAVIEFYRSIGQY